MDKYEMMDKIIQYHMRKITTSEVGKVLDEYTAELSKPKVTVGQSEQLLAFAKWIDEETLGGLLAKPEYYVKTYLKKHSSQVDEGIAGQARNDEGY